MTPAAPQAAAQRPSPVRHRVRGLGPERAARLRDALVVLVGLVGSAPWLLQRPHGEPAGLAVVLLLLGLASVASMWWRRSHPVPVALLAVVLTAATGAIATLLVALMTLAVRRRDRLFWLVTALAVCATVLSWTLAHGVDWRVAVPLGPLLIGAAICFAAYISARRALIHSLRERAERAEAEQVLRADQARLAERTRIAREMHDVLAHRISLVALHAGGLEVRPDVGPEQVEATAATIRATSRAALEDLRRVLGVLRTQPGGSGAGTAELAPQPTLADVQRLVADSRAAGVHVELRTDVSLHTQVSADLGRTVHRIVQEALTNVHKHARSASALVVLSGRPGAFLCVEVVNGRPTGETTLLPGSGSGLVGLSERVGIADGTLVSGPEPGGGFAVRARLPWPSPDLEGSGHEDPAAWAPPDARIITPVRPAPGDE